MHAATKRVKHHQIRLPVASVLLLLSLEMLNEQAGRKIVIEKMNEGVQKSLFEQIRTTSNLQKDSQLHRSEDGIGGLHSTSYYYS